MKYLLTLAVLFASCATLPEIVERPVAPDAGCAPVADPNIAFCQNCVVVCGDAGIRGCGSLFANEEKCECK